MNNAIVSQLQLDDGVNICCYIQKI